MPIAYKSPRVKPKISIVRIGNGYGGYDVYFNVRWPRRHWINSYRATLTDAVSEVMRQHRKDAHEART